MQSLSSRRARRDDDPARPTLLRQTLRGPGTGLHTGIGYLYGHFRYTSSKSQMRKDVSH